MKEFSETIFLGKTTGFDRLFINRANPVSRDMTLKFIFNLEHFAKIESFSAKKKMVRNKFKISEKKVSQKIDFLCTIFYFFKSSRFIVMIVVK